MRELSGHKGRGLKSVDWKLVIYYLLLVVIGWVNIYASIQNEEPSSIFDVNHRCGMQLIWIVSALVLAGIILFLINPRIYEGFSLPIYLFVLFLLVAVIFLGVEINGSNSWFDFGPVKFQPAEISKISTSLMLAAVMSQLGYRIGRVKDFIVTALVILVPMLIIIGQSETGSALVYVGFIFMLYREGLSGWLIFMVGMAILLFILIITILYRLIIGGKMKKSGVEVVKATAVIKERNAEGFVVTADGKDYVGQAGDGQFVKCKKVKFKSPEF